MNASLILLTLIISAITSAESCAKSSTLAVGLRKSGVRSSDDGVAIMKLRNGRLRPLVVLEPADTGENPSWIQYHFLRRQLIVTNANSKNPSFTVLSRTTDSRYFRKEATYPTSSSGTTHFAFIGRRTLALAMTGGTIDTFRLHNREYRSLDSFAADPASASVFVNSSLKRPFLMPHFHMVLPYKKGLLAFNHGSDAIFYFEVFRSRMILRSVVNTTAGYGPRHGIVHRPSGVIFVATVSGHMLTLRDEMGDGSNITVSDSILLINRPSIEGRLRAAAVRLSSDNEFLYVSLRPAKGQPGFIIGYRVNQANGIVKKIGEWSSCGDHPRDFVIVDDIIVNGKCGSVLVVANRFEDNVVVLKRDRHTGALSTNCTESVQDMNKPGSVAILRNFKKKTTQMDVSATRDVEQSWSMP